MIMKKYLALLLIPMLAACGAPKEEVVEGSQYPAYCIRDAIFLDNEPGGRVLLDMPGYPYGQTDKFQEIDRHTYNEIAGVAPVCQSGDPRMELEPSGIAWSDGRDTGLDELPDSVL